MTGSINKVSALFLISTLVLWSAQPARAGQLLKGRIEQIFGSQGETSAPKELEATAEMLDPRLIERKLAPNKVAAKLKSFPVTLRGEWRGQVKVVQTDCTESYWSTLPTEAQADKRFFQVGKVGDAMFRFFALRDQVTMAPPVVRFQVEPSEADIFKGEANAVFLEMNELRGPQWKSNSGECMFSSRLLKNTVTNLTATMVEQDILVEATIENIKTKQRTRFYSEHVLQFEKTGPFQLHVQVAEASYALGGALWKRMLLDGVLR
ncbi:MAG: hypothetical protein K2X93_00930 [Candidatus Obscuribacterales bacterium]|nr:hypothetical protein [Candidatus Obscuribacterales bacterium]